MFLPCYSDKCLLPMVVGPCKTTEVRYHYNAAMLRCEMFNYGCSGNDNNFNSSEECEKHCRGVVAPTSAGKSISQSTLYNKLIACACDMI